MIATLKQGASKNNIQDLLKALRKKKKSKGIEVSKYVGKIKLNGDALKIQKKMRNDWK